MAEQVESFAQDRFDELVASEPSGNAPSDAARWVDIYSRLTAMLERQLAETRALAERSPDAMRRYLESANVAVLQEEHERFTGRLEHWRAQQARSRDSG